MVPNKSVKRHPRQLFRDTSTGYIINLVLINFWKIVKNHYWALVIVLFAAMAMTWGLLDIPRGLTVDEAAFGLNATTLSRTGRDENGRFLPFFVLSIGGRDWRQPVTQYYQAAFFKIMGPGVYNFRLSSVVITLISSLLIYVFIFEHTRNKKLSVLAQLLFLTTPIVFIQSHMGLDNNVPMIFSLIWLIGLGRISYQKLKKTDKTLAIMAISLGLSFYAYKGMRVVVPAWGLLTGLYLIWKDKNIHHAFRFWLWLAPFFLITPYLNYKYPGSITGGNIPNFDGIYNFLYPYLSYFDPSFLFITGDATIYHSTGKHGMLVLAGLPFVVAGLIAFIKKNSWMYLMALGVAPLLMGSVGSVHRASRIMCIVPIFILIMIEGVQYLSKRKVGQFFIVICLFALSLNFVDFWKIYHYDYAKITEESFGNLKYYQAFARLDRVASAYNLPAYISKDAAAASGESGRFFQQIYFNRFLTQLDREEDGINLAILSNRQKVDGYENVGCDGERMQLCVLIKK